MSSLASVAGTVLASAALALAAGCGEEESDSGPEPLSRAQLGDAVGRLCSVYREDAGTLPRRDRDAAGFERRLASVERRLVVRLRALEPPGPDRGAFSDFIAAQQSAFRALADLRASGESGEGTSPAARRANAAVGTAQRLAFRLGFDSCTAV